jgi:protein-S-isoprenylcysteine O-methyltransferase Ste14
VPVSVMRRSRPVWTVQTRAMLYLRATAALALPLAVDVVVPAVLVRSADERIEFGVLFFLGASLIVSGSWLLLDSVFVRFAHEGRGTLAPIDPPRFVVRGGAYRVVRNPMYVANVAIIFGSGAVFGAWELAAWAAVVLVAFHLFVVIYEEPTLKRNFGQDYEDYRRDVGRWVPRRLGMVVQRRDERA